MKKNIYSLLIIIGALFNQLQAQDCNDDIHAGDGTFYDGLAGTSDGNCSLPVASNDVFYCALNTIDYANSNACGACIKVTGPKGSVVLKVVDRCPECAEGDVDMTQEAFAQIADVIDGRVDITWEFVPCSTLETPGNIKVNFKEGSSQFWTAIQFRDIEHGIETMEYRQTNGTWTSVNRELFNFFIEPVGITSPMDLRVTSVLGETLVFEDVSLDLNNDYDTGLQFSTPSQCADTTLAVDSIFSEEADLVFKMYPNPSSNFITFTNASFAKIKNEALTITCTNTLGQTINFKEAMVNGVLQIDVSKVPSGVYLIKIANAANVLYTDKLIVK